MNESVKKLTTSGVKIIGFICMIIACFGFASRSITGENIYYIFYGISLTLFLFVFADSFYHTSSKKKLFARLIIFWIITEIVEYAIMISGSKDPHIPNINAFSVFIIVGIYCLFIDNLKLAIKDKKVGYWIKSIVSFIIPIVLIVFIPIKTALLGHLLNQAAATGNMDSIKNYSYLFTFQIPSLVTTFGGVWFVILGVLFYIFKDKIKYQILSLIILSIIISIVSRSTLGTMVIGFMVLSFIPMLLYNKQKGITCKWAYYILYIIVMAVMYSSLH